MEINQRKQRLHTLILGPYRPKACLRRLEALQSNLIAQGFEKSRLVKDFPDDEKLSSDLDEHFTKKSRLCLNTWAHVPIFVFYRDADNLGVNTELSFTCLNLPNKTNNSVVFFETGMDISSQIRGSIKIAKISYETFNTDKELCALTLGHSLKVLDRLFYSV
jgi:hypothetical protein